MVLEQIIILGYAAFLFLGAFFGAKAGSKISIIMGIGSGLLIIVGDILLLNNYKTGLLVLLQVGGLLLVVFLQRLLKTKKMMPSGMLLGISALFFLFILSKYLG